MSVRINAAGEDGVAAESLSSDLMDKFMVLLQRRSCTVCARAQ
jgi:hypothetical protein